MKDGYIRVAAGSFETNLITIVGLPYQHLNSLYNVAAVIHQGALLALVPKTHIPNYQEFYEARRFEQAPKENTLTNFNGQKIPFGTHYVFASTTNSDFKFGVEICEDLWVAQPPAAAAAAAGANVIVNLSASNETAGKAKFRRELVRLQSARSMCAYVYASSGEGSRQRIWFSPDLPDAPSTKLALNGANLILNPSASNEITTKSDYRRLLVSSQSARLVCGYVYCNAGNGESTTDVVFSGHHIISENGTMIKESRGFDSELIYGDLDLKKLSSERRKMTTFKSYHNYETIYFDSTNIDLNTTYYYDPHPFVPSNRDLRAKRCKEVFDIQTRGLMQRLKATGIKKVVIGISGGLDSTLALLVCTMAFKKLNYDTKDIIAITMPCFGTTSRTKNNALGLMEELAVTSIEVDITESVRIQFRDIEQDENIHDVTYENVQARTRTEILMNKANQVGGLVIGTGDLSEVALGWSTYNGDHMSMYAVNVSVPKTLVRYLVDYIASLYHGEKLETILKDILDTPVSPELLPQENDQIVQKTEDIVGPYELHDFFIYHMVRFGDEPRKLYRKTKLAFKDKYDKKTIKKWLTKFYWRFFSQQFKRSCIPDGPKVGSVSLSPRGDWRMPSDANVSNWIDEIEKI